MSTALAPVENGHDTGLDLSSYHPQAYNILSPVLRLDTAAQVDAGYEPGTSLAGWTAEQRT